MRMGSSRGTSGPCMDAGDEGLVERHPGGVGPHVVTRKWTAAADVYPDVRVLVVPLIFVDGEK